MYNARVGNKIKLFSKIVGKNEYRRVPKSLDGKIVKVININTHGNPEIIYNGLRKSLKQEDFVIVEQIW